MTRNVLILSFSLAAIALACSSNDDATPGASSSGSSGSLGSSGTAPTGSGFKSCSSAGSGAQSRCTEAEMKPYNDCVQEKCSPQYEKCYGPDYKKGVFSGPCGTFITCIQKCDCSDLSCVQKCVTDTSSDACSACSKDLESCGETCTEPECAKTTPDAGTAGGKTCADLTACCDAITDADQKTACNQAKTGAGSNDSMCSLYYTGFKAGGLCP